jgi:hypothetical protein
MTDKLNEILSDALGTEYKTTTSNVVTVKATVIVPTVQVPTYIDVGTVEEQEAEEDFKKSRETYDNILSQGNEAVTKMLEIASEDETARSFEVVATLIKTMSDASKSFYDMHEVRRRMKESRRPNADGGNFTIDKAVFVGSPRELLQQMKQKQLEESDG